MPCKEDENAKDVPRPIQFDEALRRMLSVPQPQKKTKPRKKKPGK
jgi:hypothetical protein